MDDEGEEDDGPVALDDSQSEGSVPTEPVEGDAEGGDEGDGEDRAAGSASEKMAKGSASTTSADKSKKSRRSKRKAGKKADDSVEPSRTPAQANFQAMADTEAMMNGLKIGEEGQDEAVDFANMNEQVAAPAASAAQANPHVASAAERQRRQHEEYRRKRDSDPAFIPNRGNFFMHDTRGQPNGQVPPPRGAWAARGRGRGMPNAGGPFPPSNQMAHVERPAEQQWKHDLHSTVNEDARSHSSARPVDSTQDQIDSARLFPKAPAPAQAQHAMISFSSTKLVGKVQIRVVLPGTKAPINFSAVPWKQYIRLPDHRPPLRRDKPVRVSLPGHTQRYIFPSTERSFIFIPRQMRPNQQRFGHSAYQRSVGGYGYSSRRTSMYGGSMYSASVAASRRSSLAGMNRDRAFSPAGTFPNMPHNRPVVRLPHSTQHSSFSTPVGPLSGVHTPTGMPQMYNVPPPQAPVYQGTPTTTVHQPRPQKTISVTGIESPAVLEQAASEPQPFQNQLPAHMNEPPPPPPYFSPRQQYPYAQQQPVQTGTPLSGIPEQAIHAPAFQPPMYNQQGYYASYAPQQPNYYYSPPNHNGYPPMPMYQMPHQSYMGPPMGGTPYQHPPPAPTASQPMEESHHQQQQSRHQPQPSQSGMVAHESNGMVFYTSASEAQTQGGGENYQPAESFVPSYAMPGLPPPTPAPENQMSHFYYGQPPMDAMQEVGTGIYYPAQHHQQQGQ